MRVAMIGHKDFPSRSGGVEVVVYELATRLSREGHQVAVYNRGREKGHNAYIKEGVQVYRTATVKNQSLNALLYSITATMAALRRQYDLIHYHALGPSVMLLAAHLLGRKTVATVHGLDWQRAKWNRLGSAYLKLGERIIARYADAVIVLSRGVAAYFQETYGRTPVMIENGIVPVEYASCSRLTREFGLHHRGFILFLARIVPEKGLHDLVAAFADCRTEKKLVIAGELPDTEYGRQIQAMAAKDRRIVFTGFAQGEILRALYHHCSLYVLPSYVEGMALTLLEAMSAGARCLTSDIPENADVLGGFGSTFPAGDVTALKNRLQESLDAGTENLQAQAQMEYIQKKYDYTAVVEKTLGVYEEVVGYENC